MKVLIHVASFCRKGSIKTTSTLCQTEIWLYFNQFEPNSSLYSEFEPNSSLYSEGGKIRLHRHYVSQLGCARQCFYTPLHVSKWHQCVTRSGGYKKIRKLCSINRDIIGRLMPKAWVQVNKINQSSFVKLPHNISYQDFAL